MYLELEDELERRGLVFESQRPNNREHPVICISEMLWDGTTGKVLIDLNRDQAVELYFSLKDWIYPTRTES